MVDNPGAAGRHDPGVDRHCGWPGGAAIARRSGVVPGTLAHAAASLMGDAGILPRDRRLGEGQPAIDDDDLAGRKRSASE